MESLVRLMRIGPEAVPLLIESLKNEKRPPRTRALAAQALGFLADARARPVLLQAIEDKCKGTRKETTGRHCASRARLRNPPFNSSSCARVS